MLEATIRQSLGGRAPLEEGLKFLLVTEADQGQLVLELFVHEGASTVLIVRAEAQLQELERLMQQRRKRHVPAENPSQSPPQTALMVTHSAVREQECGARRRILKRTDHARGGELGASKTRSKRRGVHHLQSKIDRTAPITPRASQKWYLGFAT